MNVVKSVMSIMIVNVLLFSILWFFLMLSIMSFINFLVFMSMFNVIVFWGFIFVVVVVKKVLYIFFR